MIRKLTEIRAVGKCAAHLNPGREEGFDVALASTDTTAQADALIARYDSRWTIETAHQASA